jgi:hypothetical protein
MTKPLNAWKVTIYNRTLAEMEEFVAFSMCVAGKRADTTSRALSRFLGFVDDDVGTPFEKIRFMIDNDLLNHFLRSARLGKYNLLERAFCKLVELKPEDLYSIDKLETVPGIGPKTSRFIVLHSVPNARYAALDTHVLKYLRSKGYDAPKSTPSSGSKYRELEQIFLKEADAAGMSPADFDLTIWKSYTTSKEPVDD